MANAASYVSKEQPSIADDVTLTNAFYDAPTVITMFAPIAFVIPDNADIHIDAALKKIDSPLDTFC